MATFNEQLYISAMYVAGYDRAPDYEGYTLLASSTSRSSHSSSIRYNFQTVLRVTLLLQHSMAV